MLVQFVMMRDYNAVNAHVEEDSKIEVPYGHIHDRIHSDGPDSEIYNTVEHCLNAWSACRDDESPPVLVMLPDELSFHMSLMGVQPMNYLVYDLESGRIAFSDRMNDAIYEIRSKNRGASGNRGISASRGRRGSTTPEVTPFFDFAVKDPNEGKEPFVFYIEDRDMVNDIAEFLMPYLKHRLKSNFIKMVNCVHSDIIEDYVYDNGIPHGMTLNNYYFADDPLIKYNSKRKNTCYFSDHEVEIFMHVLRECNALYMEIRKENPWVHHKLERLFDLLRFELQNDLQRY